MKKTEIRQKPRKPLKRNLEEISKAPGQREPLTLGEGCGLRVDGDSGLFSFHAGGFAEEELDLVE
jgi:hypothetical protein